MFEEDSRVEELNAKLIRLVNLISDFQAYNITELGFFNKVGIAMRHETKEEEVLGCQGRIYLQRGEDPEPYCRRIARSLQRTALRLFEKKPNIRRVRIFTDVAWEDPTVSFLLGEEHHNETGQP